MRANFEKGTKICSSCKKELPLDMFGRSSGEFDGLNKYCKECVKYKSALQRQRRVQLGYIKIEKKMCSCCHQIKSIEEFHKTPYSKDRRKGVCKECANKKNREYSKKECAKETRRRAMKKFIAAGKMNEWDKKRRESDLNYRIRKILRNRIYQSVIKKKNSKKDSSENLLGCSIEFLKQYLESKFQSEMTWENYGRWDIDHIIPCSYFDLTKEENQRICFNYRNLQPLWSEENRWNKNAKVPENVEEIVEQLRKEIL